MGQETPQMLEFQYAAELAMHLSMENGSRFKDTQAERGMMQKL